MSFPSTEGPSMDNQVNGDFAGLGPILPIHNGFYYPFVNPLAYLPSQSSYSEVDGYLNLDGENYQYVNEAEDNLGEHIDPTGVLQKKEAEDNEEYFSNFPSGYRFMPLDKELIESYLKPKIFNQTLPRNQIADVDLYSYDPVTLTAGHKAIGDNEWYFFTSRNRKYPKGERPNRNTGDGYWKATGADKEIMSKKVKVGSKKSLVYYKGEPLKGKKTDWHMHEYRVSDLPKRQKTSENDMKLDDWVLCRIRKKNRPEKNVKAEAESDSSEPSSGGDQQQKNCGDSSSGAGISNPMAYPFAQDQVSSSYAQQPMPFVPRTNDPVHGQNTYQSCGNGIYQQGQESVAFQTPGARNK